MTTSFNYYYQLTFFLSNHILSMMTSPWVSGGVVAWPNDSRTERSKHCTNLYPAEIQLESWKTTLEGSIGELYGYGQKYPSCSACSYFNGGCSLTLLK